MHRSERTDALVEQLAALLADPPDDPFTPDVVAVPTRGVERWIAQRLSHHLGAGPDGEPGVCANVVFGSPARLVGDVLSAVLGIEAEQDAWHADRLVWRLLDVVDACAGQAWCSPLGRHLGVGDPDDLQRRGRRLAVARHLARLFDSYAAQRPAMLRAWADGKDDDGAGDPVPYDLGWQQELWRRLRERVGVPSPAERLDDALRLLATDPRRVDLPGRLSVFGPTRVAEQELQVLHALATHRDVHLWLLHPSPVLWQRVATGAAASPRRRDHAGPAEHPLLASMARDATELQLRLTALGGATASTHHPASPPRPTLLGALQQRLRADDPGAAPMRLDAADRSVQVHACHGRARQVEVLREVLVGLLADDDTLEPRDVLVMCPDIEAVAPLVSATFGLAGGDGGEHAGHGLRVSLADRSLRRTNPVLSLLSRLLELADGRVTASEVLDLAAAEPVRRRFRLDDDDLDRIREWAVAAGVRWGEDVARRARFGLAGLHQGTWEAALDRVLLGAAMADEDHRYVGTALPLDDVDSTDVDLAGRLAELVDRLADVLAALDGVHSLHEWLDALDRGLDLLADVGPADGWQVVQARQVLADVRTSARLDGADPDPDLPLRLPDVRALLAGRLQGRPTRAGFRTGALTMCSLEPMRAVPHRVVCLLGLDDGAFPRGTATDGDDLLLRDPLLGERDRRSEDRQLFLDAVTSARDHLVVLYSGADERTGAHRAPAVPVGELLDALDAAATTGDRRPVRARVLVRHPLQTVDERNFTSSALGRSGPFSFDAVAHRAAVAGRGSRTGAAPFLPGPLPPEQWQPEIDLDDLVAALEHPVKALLRKRLRVSLVSEGRDVEDRLPLSLDPLESWQVGDRLLAARLARVDKDRAIAVELRRGEVPPRGIGRALLDKVVADVLPVAGAADAHAAGPAAAVDVTVELPDRRVITGTVPGVHSGVVVRAVYSRLGPKHRLRAWVQLLALVATQPQQSWRTVTIGRGGASRSIASVAALRPPSAPYAVRRLAELVALRDRALREPLPMPVATGYAYARSRHAGEEEVQALEDARKAWRDGFDKADDHHVVVWGENAPFDVLLDTPDATEQAWWPHDRTRLGVLARRVWHPLLDHERRDTV